MDGVERERADVVRQDEHEPQQSECGAERGRLRCRERVLVGIGEQEPDTKPNRLCLGRAEGRLVFAGRRSGCGCRRAR